ncbi:hypothetical protein VNI00_016273 [Paramarasmius palmivorus]|uniref:Uncharacterized protein n=1 Tax=Paramarasmius palmivorus TaxID=297713 RepID=A0AAW0BEZ0_9AGAR
MSDMAVKPQKQIRVELRELNDKFTARMAALSQWVDTVEEDMCNGVPPTPLTIYLQGGERQLVPDKEPAVSTISPHDEDHFILAHETSQVFNAALGNGQNSKVTYLDENHGSVKNVRNCIECNHAQKITPHDLERAYIKHQLFGIDDANTDDGYSPSHSSHGTFDESSRSIILPPHGDQHQRGEFSYDISPKVVDQQHNEATQYNIIDIPRMKDTNLPKGRNKSASATIAYNNHLAKELTTHYDVYGHCKYAKILTDHTPRKLRKFEEANHLPTSFLPKKWIIGDYHVQTLRGRVDDGGYDESRVNACLTRPKPRRLPRLMTRRGLVKTLSFQCH